MSSAFHGLKDVRKAVKFASERTGVKMSVRTVSQEPTVYREGEYPIDRGDWERGLIRLFAAYAPDRANSWREYGIEFENDVFRVHPDYQSEDCTCTYDSREKDWLVQNPHSADCFQPYISGLVERIEAVHPLPECDLFRVMDEIDSKEFVNFWHGGPALTEEEKNSKKERQIAEEAKREAFSVAYKAQQKAISELVWREAKSHSVKGSGGVKLTKESAEWLWKYLCTCGRDERHHQWQLSQCHERPCERWWSAQPNFLHKPSGYGVYWYKYPCRDAHGDQPITLRRFQGIIRECIKSIALSEK